jgi:hypothetical protein
MLLPALLALGAAGTFYLTRRGAASGMSDLPLPRLTGNRLTVDVSQPGKLTIDARVGDVVAVRGGSAQIVPTPPNIAEPNASGDYVLKGPGTLAVLYAQGSTAVNVT